MTLADRLAATNGRPSGFDYLRVGLALAVVVTHSFELASPSSALIIVANSPLRPILAVIVPMFFALSGFLVAGSLERSATLVTFLGLRALRIFPALSVEVFLSALFLGPAVTSLTINQYFSSPEVYNYLWNITGDIHYLLPGVFEHNPGSQVVNSQLWTVPFELVCYVSLASLALLTLARRRLFMLAVVGAVQLLWALQYGMANRWHAAPLDFANVRGRVLVFSFLFGVLLYGFRDRVVWSGAIALGCAASAWLLLMNPFGSNLSAVPISYLTVYLGLTMPRRLWIVESGDYSYGIYLFGVPIQQTVLTFGTWTYHWYVVLGFSIVPICLFAAASWHLVEKRANRLRPVLKTIEKRYMVARSTLAGSIFGLARPSRT